MDKPRFPYSIPFPARDRSKTTIQTVHYVPSCSFNQFLTFQIKTNPAEFTFITQAHCYLILIVSFLHRYAIFKKNRLKKCLCCIPLRIIVVLNEDDTS